KMDTLLANMGEALANINNREKSMGQATSDLTAPKEDVSQKLNRHDEQFKQIRIQIAAMRSMRSSDECLEMTDRHLCLGLIEAQQSDITAKMEESIADLTKTAASFSPTLSVTSNRIVGWGPTRRLTN
ncbi:unnamed protein product, partial [Prorocentrum cordatum]